MKVPPHILITSPEGTNTQPLDTIEEDEEEEEEEDIDEQRESAATSNTEDQADRSQQPRSRSSQQQAVGASDELLQPEVSALARTTSPAMLHRTYASESRRGQRLDIVRIGGYRQLPVRQAVNMGSSEVETEDMEEEGSSQAITDSVIEAYEHLDDHA